MAKARAGVGGELRGRVGGLVYVGGPNGTVVREVPRSRGVSSRARVMAEERVALAAGAWQRMSPEAMGRWRAYAESLMATEPALARAPARGYLAFSSLAVRVMQIELGANVPTEPPTGFFAGDGVRVEVEPLPLGRGRGGVEGVAEDGSTPSLPSTWEATPEDSRGSDLSSPPSADPPKGESPGVTFSADRANAPGVVTELLTQPLANAGRTPVGSKYRSRAFVAFASGSLAVPVGLPSGWHAGAVRFVERASGRCTALFPCGIVRVG